MTTYRLDRRQQTVVAPVLDEFQQRVVDHPGGPLLVLAGPGTGKTTTMVEAIVDLVEQRGVDPGAILALTFSRKAAEQLRDRVTARLGRTMSTSLSSTFHSFAYGLLRAYSSSDRSAEPLRLLSAAEQDVVLRELLTNAPESVTWPDELRAAVGTRGFAREVQAVLSRAREKRLDATALQKIGSEEGRLDWVAAGQFMEQYLTNLDSQSAIDYANLVVRGGQHRGTPRRAAAAARSLLARLRRRVPGHRPQPGRPAQGPRRRRAQPGGRRRPRPVDLRLPRRRGPGHPRLPRRLPDGATGRRRPWSPWAPPGGSAAAAAAGLALARDRAAAERSRSLPSAWQAFRQPTAARRATPARSRSSPTTPPAPRPSTSPTRFAAPTSRTASRGRRWRCWCGRGRTTIPSLRRSLTRRASPSRWPPTRHRWSASLRCSRCSTRCGPWSTSTTTTRMHPDYLDPGRVESLLLSPLGGLDATEVRAVARALRRREKAEEGQRSSTELRPRLALLDPALLEGLTTNAATQGAAAGRAAAQGARRSSRTHATAEEVLWTLWSGDRLAGPAPAVGDLGRAGRADGPPRPRRDLRPLRDRGPGRGAARLHAASPASSRPWWPSRSPPTPSRSGGSAATPCGC